MADIKIVCSACETENTFSEYARPESRVCRECGQSLTTEGAVERKKLSLRSMSSEDGEKVTLRGAEKGAKEKPRPSDHSEESTTAPHKKDATRVRLKSPSSFILGLLVFILLTALLVGLQYFGQTDAELREIYSLVRLVALALAYLAVLIDAFREGQVPGFLALLFPPYLIYYAIAKLDSFWRQGVFFAVIVMLGAELHFMKDDAAVIHFNKFIKSKIDYVSDQLDKAGKSSAPKL